MSGKRVLLVEDSKRVQNYNKRMLEDVGFVAETATTLAAAWKSLERQMPDAIILDIGMPDGNGLDFLQKLRNTSKVPVLLLTGSDTNEDVVKGFQSGCDDYLPKPYTFEVLLVRLKRLLERAAQVPDRVEYGAIVIDILSRQAFSYGKDLWLKPKEYSLLLFFVQNARRTISSEELYQKVWNAPLGGDKNALQANISTLRKKIGHSGCDIHNVQGKGYCFE